MKLNDVNLIENISIENKLELMRKVPDKRISDVSTILVIKHNENYYVLKVRPGHEDKLKTEEFEYHKKSEVHYETFEKMSQFCNKIVGKCVLFDITGYKLNIK